MSYDELTLFEIHPDLQDETEQAQADEVRSLIFDLPERPGTKR